ncbi:MAG TPA: polysaccharide biosynthesis protein, partial [Ferruginibacter sp.]|nr:polysaccharide biosynthesis protein [Ferruginibacter sp.]
VLVVLIYFIHLGLLKFISGSLAFSLGSGLLLFLLFTWFVSRVEAKELAKLPVIGKYFQR